MSSVYITHGGGPLPLIHKKQHEEMYRQFEQISSAHSNVKAVIIFSAHWCEEQWTILDIDHPPLYYDYYGFPPETYNLDYSIHSTQQLREHICQALLNEGYELKRNKKRGYDHGVFIPMMIMFPKGNVPIIQISMVNSLNPQSHYKMGQALKKLKQENFLIIGSGSSVHGGFRNPQTNKKSQIFDTELTKIVETKDPKQVLEKIKNWRKLPFAEEFHSPEDHLVPLFINLGAAQLEAKKATYKLYLMGAHMSNYVLS